MARIKTIDDKLIKKRVQDVLDQVSLDKNRDTLSIKLSGGLRRRLCIAMGIIADSRVLILDEPTTGLDPLVRDQIWSLLKTLK